MRDAEEANGRWQSLFCACAAAAAGSVSAGVTLLEGDDSAGGTSSSDAPSVTSRFVSVAGPVTDSTMNRLRGEGYVYVGRQRTSSEFMPHVSQRESRQGEPGNRPCAGAVLLWQALHTCSPRITPLAGWGQPGWQKLISTQCHLHRK